MIKMKIAGIITEYNPFHNGHAYQIRVLKNEHHIDGVVCAMSGNFTQRGEPALVNKRARAQMALYGGADLIIELPALYSVRSAWWFAYGGCKLLSQTGVINHLVFGSEKDNLNELTKAAKILEEEPSDYREALLKNLKAGLSYSSAQSNALVSSQPNLPVFTEPNERLAINCLRIIHALDLPLKPVLVPRKESSHNDRSLLLGDEREAQSASALRNKLATAESLEDALSDISRFMPMQTSRILKETLDDGKSFVFLKDMSQALMALIRRSGIDELNNLPDSDTGLSRRFLDLACSTADIDEFLAKLKTRRFSEGRLIRMLTHLFLNYTKDTARYIAAGPEYIRVLGFNDKGRFILRLMKERSSIPIILKGGQLNSLAKKSPAFLLSRDLDIRAGNLYNMLEKAPPTNSGSAEYLWSPVYLS